MKKLPLCRNDEGENFVVISKFNYKNNPYFCVLNVLDEYLSENEIIRFPTIEARCINNKVKIVGYISCKNVEHIFWPAFHRMQQSDNNILKSELDSFMIEQISTALNQSLS